MHETLTMLREMVKAQLCSCLSKVLGPKDPPHLDKGGR